MSLIEFYGNSCPHCEKMKPLVDDLKKEGIEVEELEVWENEENEKRMVELDKGLCGGVPFFINTETKSFLCGEATYDELRAWAAGK